MSKAGAQIIESAQSGIGKSHFLNPFTGTSEEFISERDANNKMLAAAAERINDLQAEIDAIKSFLVL